MGSKNRRRSTRACLAMIVLATLISGPLEVARAVVPIGATGTHGEYSVTDTPATPGARCRYEGAAGTWYLSSMHVPAPTIYGTSAQLQSVGYRLLLQRGSAHGWQTVQRGTLVSGVADKSSAAALTGSTVARDVDVAPNWPRYRAVIRLTWWDANAQVEGRVVLAIEHHRRTSDRSVGPACRGRVPIAQ